MRWLAWRDADPVAPLSFKGRTDFGPFLQDRVFRPGTVQPWPQLVRDATGEPLSAKYFAAEVRLGEVQ